eukprot:4401940-Alexandrium_andersonii.AAC.1
MSASLVGSEMCIRDRRTHCALQATALQCSTRLASLPCQALPAPWTPRLSRARPAFLGPQAQR